MGLDLLKTLDCWENFKQLIIWQEIESLEEVSFLFQEVLQCFLDDVEKLIADFKGF